MSRPMLQSGATPVRVPAAVWILGFALSFEIALVSPLLFHDLGPKEMNRFVLFGILQLPYVLSLVTLVCVKNAVSTDFARGLAIAVSVSAFIAEAILAFGATLLWSWTVKDDPKSYVMLLILVGINVVIFFAATFSGKGHRLVFSLAFLGTAVYCFLIPWTMKSAWNVQRVNSEQVRMTEFAAAKGMRALIACLNDYRFHNPGAGFPPSLQSIPSSSNCNPSFGTKDTFAGYELQYIPSHAASSAEITGFQLVATPHGFKTPGMEPIVSNDRGEIAEVSGWSTSAGKLQLLPLSNDGGALAVMAAAKDFTRRDRNHRPPRTFDDLVGPSSVLANHGPSGALGTKFQSAYFVLEYFPPLSEGSDQFSMAENCAYYGTDCLRSFLYESSGDIHATAEPRAATHNDPLVSPSCLVQAKCPSLVWPTP
ncbi:MAG: hypothetical protein WCD43_07850 [Candidatus Acidiferrales bacterium]